MRRRCCGDALAGSALFSSSIEVTTLPSQRRKNLPAEKLDADSSSYQRFDQKCATLSDNQNRRWIGANPGASTNFFKKTNSFNLSFPSPPLFLHQSVRQRLAGGLAASSAAGLRGMYRCVVPRS
jgi:hypothetical protein